MKKYLRQNPRTSRRPECRTPRGRARHAGIGDQHAIQIALGRVRIVARRAKHEGVIEHDQLAQVPGIQKKKIKKKMYTLFNFYFESVRCFL